MATFFATVILLLPILLAWWLISPIHYPFTQNLSRPKIILHGILVLLALLIILAITAPPTDQSTPEASDIIGLLLAMIALAALITKSIKTKKSRISVQAETKPVIIQDPRELQKEAEKNQPNEAIDHQARIEEEAKIRATQDAQFQAQQEELKQALASLQEELRATKTELSQTQNKLTEKNSALEEALQSTKELLESQQHEQQSTKLEPKKIQKPAPNHDLVLGDDSVCIMVYTGSDGKTSSRPIIPRELKINKNGDWVISAVDIDASRVKSFRVDRISYLSHNGQEFTHQDDILSTLRAIEITL